MALLPPVPVNSPFGSYSWLDWYQKVRTEINNAGTIEWSNIDFTGSDITDIVTRNHNNLSSIQGGTAGEYYHLTAAEYANVANAMSINRIVRGTISIASGSNSNTYTISPAVSSLQKVELRFLGVDTNGNSANCPYIELTNTTTITATRSTNGNVVVVSFEFTEYN